MAKEFFETIVADAGFAGEYEALTETEISGPSVGAYVPGEDGVWKIISSRTVQLLQGSPVHIQTFQLSAAVVRMPSGSLPSVSSGSDAQDGRFYFIRNDITATGIIILQKADSTFLGTLDPGDFAIVLHGDNDIWDVRVIPNSGTTLNADNILVAKYTDVFNTEGAEVPLIVISNSGNVVVSL